MEWIQSIWSVRWAAGLIVAGGSLLGAWISQFLLLGILRRVASRTATQLDDKVLELLKRPIFYTLLLLGFDRAVHTWGPSQAISDTARAVFFTIAIAFWSITLMRLSRTVLQIMADRPRPGGIVQSQTLPLFEIVIKTGVLAAAIYFAMVAWHVDVGAWLASAGVVGVAAGFAAQDSLANYFAGVFIIADAPYKLKDVITLDDGTRGTVIDIGLRSTRIHTQDGVEINIPNSILGSMKIENRSAGPSIEERVAIEVGVAYGSDIEKVAELLKKTAVEVENVLAKPPPEVYFKSFGASSLDLDVKVWIRPPFFEQVRHDLHLKIYDALNQAEIEIPFPQRDLHVKEIPPTFGV